MKLLKRLKLVTQIYRKLGLDRYFLFFVNNVTLSRSDASFIQKCTQKPESTNLLPSFLFYVIFWVIVIIILLSH